MDNSPGQQASKPSTESSAGRDDTVLAAFVKELEAVGAEQVDLNRWIRDYPALAADFRDMIRTIANLDRSRPLDEPAIPLRLGEFRILRKLAHGGMGEVYLAEQETLKRLVAIKTIRQGRVSPENRKRFLREQEVLASLHQTHIVPIHTAGSEQDLQYFAMPYIKGTTLQQVLRMAANLALSDPASPTPALGRLAAYAMSGSTVKATDGATCNEAQPEVHLEYGPAMSDQEAKTTSPEAELFLPSMAYYRSVARVLADVAEAIEHAHSAGILHRDVKPSNIMVDEKEQSWVIDFGLASHCDGAIEESAPSPIPTADSLTQTGRFVGTPAYMAPEQFLRMADARTDVWGLGVTLYEMLTARRAFEGDDFTAVGDRVRTAHVRRPQDIVRTAPRDLEAICLKALEKDPNSRYQSLQVMADDLRRWLRTEPIIARRPGIVRRTVMLMQRHRLASVVATVAMVMALVFVAVTSWTRYQRRLNLERNIGESMAEARAFLQAKDYATAHQQLMIARASLEEAGWQDETLAQAISELLEQASAKMHAERTYAEFQRLRRQANNSLFHLVNAKSKAAAEDARAALSQYSVLTDLDWKSKPDFQNLDAGRQAIVEKSAAELIFSFARTRMRGLADPDSARRESIDYLSRIETFHRPIPAVYLWISQSWRLLGEEQRAQEAAQRAASLTPTSSLDFYVLAKYQSLNGNNEEAIENLSLALQREPNDFLCMLSLGSIYFQLKRFEQAEAMLTGAIAVQPESTVAIYLRGGCSEALGKYDLALADYAMIIRLDPEDPLPYYAEGILRMHRGELTQCIALFDKAVALDPSSHSSITARAAAHASSGNHAAAIDDFTIGIRLLEAQVKLNPVWRVLRDQLADAYVLRGACRADLGQPGAALADFQAALTVEPGFVRAYHVRSQKVYLPAGHFELAIMDLSKAIEIEPENINHYRHRAAVYEKLNMVDAADNDQKSIRNLRRRMEPKTALEHNDVAWCFAADPNPQLRDAARAVKLATKAVEMAPTEGNFWNTLGVAQYRVGDWAAAIEALNKSMDLRNGGDSNDWFFLAMAYWQSGDQDKARQWYGRACAWMDQHAADNRELARFRAESSELLGINQQPQTGDDTSPRKDSASGDQ